MTAEQSQTDLDALLSRHRAFWQRTPVDRPLMRVRDYRFISPNPDVPLRGGRRAGEGDAIDPTELDLDAMLTRWPAPTEVANGDYLHELVPYGLCWMEGLMGATVRASSGSIWSDPVEFDLASAGQLRRRLDPSNPWYATLREYTARLAEVAAGRVPIAQTLMRGPIDVAEALLGTEELALAVNDHPAELAELLDCVAEAFVQVGRIFAEVAPPWHGGRAVFGIWTPGTVIRLQSDHSVLLSPASYRRWCQPLDARISAAFDYSIFHLHSGCIHILDALLELEALDGIQLTLDVWPSGPRLFEVLPQLTKIQRAGKSLLITGGPVSQDELDEALRTLPAAGLAIDVGLGSTWD